VLWDLVFSPNDEFQNLDIALHKNLIYHACSEKMK
jgi:hypothetical protein